MIGLSLDVDYLRSVLDYAPTSGVFTWRERSHPQHGFKSSKQCSMWNRRWAETTAGVVAGSGYLEINICHRRYQAHRLAWAYVTGEFPLAYIDHIDGDPLNNRLSNLRLATKSQNGANRKISSNNTSGFKGVTWDRRHDMWRSKITKDGRVIDLGSFSNLSEAAAAYEKAARDHYGEFARMV